MINEHKLLRNLFDQFFQTGITEQIEYLKKFSDPRYEDCIRDFWTLPITPDDYIKMLKAFERKWVIFNSSKYTSSVEQFLDFWENKEIEMAHILQVASPFTRKFMKARFKAFDVSSLRADYSRYHTERGRFK